MWQLRNEIKGREALRMRCSTPELLRLAGAGRVSGGAGPSLHYRPAAPQPFGRRAAPRGRRLRTSARRGSGERQGRLEAEEVGADLLEVRFAALDLLGHGAQVAIAPLERARGED